MVGEHHLGKINHIDLSFKFQQWLQRLVEHGPLLQAGVGVVEDLR